ncbi:hypothetical protein O6H91_03G052800 [Diphasiastrum complanatum]|uniref:Uncharacterized protein n=2 Tax=Diphasiastrum complanatum TaxID=34168 RepID=A0ACC2E6B7_DIPCM|nr:hypothetical protein O6H91_Y110900 [Diphasiastrum complanatum]KAJ7562032.1 hypothetical protein O6H91_03G052800 [Diphasiastrum complanatum]
MSNSKRSSLMPFKSIIREIQDLKGGIGSLSRRSFEVRLPYHHRSRSHIVVLDDNHYENETVQQSNWSNMPPELLTDVIKRVECSESSWPSRKHVVACAAVCSTWREITKELVEAPELSGKLTFPISLKQPGPRDATMQCFIKRDRMTSTYNLYLGLSANIVENGKFLLSARKFRRASSSDYVISLDAENFSRGSNSYMGKLRSNFLGTKFTIYDSQPPHYGAVALTPFTERAAKQGASKVLDGNYIVAHIAYELNVLGTRGPRRMQCTLVSVATSAMEARGSLPASVELASVDEVMTAIPHPKSKSAVADCSSADCELVTASPSKSRPLILKNKAPRWHEQLQCWCLNFRGRVTVASVKNFQLVAAAEPTQSLPQSEYDKVLLQFGKIGKDIFTMDYRYPLSAFQAFAICLSSFDTKLACE